MSDGRSGGRYCGRSGWRSGGRSGARSGGRSGVRSGGKSGGRFGRRSGWLVVFDESFWRALAFVTPTRGTFYILYV